MGVIPFKKKWALCALAVAAVLAGGWQWLNGEEETAIGALVGYNHRSDIGVAGWINGIETPPLFPKSGGGSATCCLDVPKKWKPGMKMTVYWKYGTDSDEAAPHSAVVDIPEYAPNRNGRVHVHFYPDDKVRVVVTRYYLGHPYYPLPKAEWTTWELHENAVIGEEWDKERGEPPPPKIERIWGKQWGVNLYND